MRYHYKTYRASKGYSTSDLKDVVDAAVCNTADHYQDIHMALGAKIDAIVEIIARMLDGTSAAELERILGLPEISKEGGR